MKDNTHDMDFDEFDDAMTPKPEESDFDRIVESAISRRGMLGGVLAFGGVAMIGGALAPKAQAAAHAKPARFAFEQIGTSTADAITLPPGYSYDIIARWGDAPIDTSLRLAESRRSAQPVIDLVNTVFGGNVTVKPV